ncbi:hypothetical protein ACQ4PT_041561 [Festuca glaucescens]
MDLLYIVLIFSLPYTCLGKCEIVKLLLSRGADVHGKSEEGTPLHFAAIKGHESTVEINKLVLSCLLAPLDAAIFASATPCAKLLIQCGRMPIELAAVYATREDVELLFPFTSPIPDVADWSVDGIIKSCQTGEHAANGMDDEAVDMRKSDLKQQGDEAFEKQDYTNASVLYTKALRADPSDRKMLANRSLCWLHLGDGQRLWRTRSNAS